MDSNKVVKVLMVDDHEMIIEGYRNVLSRVNIEGLDISFNSTNNCTEAWNIISAEPYDIVFLDINFPVIEGSKLISGEDLGVKIKNEMLNVRIIILTTLEDKFRLQNILYNINPEGFLLKGETNSKELVKCLERVIESPPYYGQKISKILRTKMEHDFTLDQVDRKILYQLSLGTKTKDLPEQINLSLRAIENRKRKLKEIFDIEGSNNKLLLQKVRESGYI